MNKEKIIGLLFYFDNAADVDEGIREEVISVLKSCLDEIARQEEAAAKKHKSPNKSGVVQINADNGKIINEFDTQKAALEALGKNTKSGIGDALNGRVKTHMAYGFRWYFKDELDQAKANGHLK